MKKMTANKKVILNVVALVLAVCICLFAFCIAAVGFADESESVAPQAADQRIGLSDLMSRHGVDYVIGPTVPEFESGNLKYNNNYGITSDKYFSYENYLYIDDEGGKKTLHGWKNGILPANLAEIVIKPDGTAGSNGQVYIYEEKKYVIVLPDDVEVLGTSNYYYDKYFEFNSSYTKPSVKSYTNFSFYWGISNSNRTVNWCPRERLAGIYCGPNSRLSEVVGVASGATVPKDRADTGTSDNSVRKQQCDVMRPALYACNNMRFCILPNGVTVNGTSYKLNNIGRYAFANCNQLRDVNIPSNVGSVGDYAFSACSQLAHITIPADVTFGSGVFSGTSNLRDVVNHNSAYAESDFSNAMNYTTSDSGSRLYAIGTKDGDDGTQAFYFCYNTKLGNSTALVTKDGKADNKIVGYSNKTWYAIGLAGLEDKQKQTIYEFPTTVAAGVDDPRRKDIVYDYINPDGTAHKNTLSSAINSYDIADNMVYSTWCSNVIIPSSVKNIGDNAFNFCHLQYLEIGSAVQNIGYRSFYDNKGQMGTTDCPVGAVAFNNVQYYYIHSKNVSNIGDGAFTNSSTTAGTKANSRWFIFDSKADMDANKSKYTTTQIQNVVYKYEVPVYAVVESKDGDVKVNGDMDTLFRHDSDRADVSASDNTYTVIYTKRLGGHTDKFVKLRSGRWADASSVPSSEVAPALPMLEGNSATVWYGGENYKSVLSDLTNVYPNNPSGDLYCIYTKKIGVPKISPENWTYTEEMNNAVNSDTYSFNNLLGLDASDYEVELVSYRSKTDVSDNPDYVNAAGDYKLHYKMNSAFGEWENADDEKYNIDVTVAQYEIDLYALANIPEFYAKGSSLDSPLLGDSTQLYLYGNAWYTDKKETDANVEAKVSNSYIVYTASGISIAPKSDWDLYNIDAANINAHTDSGYYNTTFTLSVKSSINYAFIYNGSSDGFTQRNLSFQYRDKYSATLDKGWYIVQPLNWLVDNATGGSGDSTINDQYVLAAKALSGMVSSWTYEDDDIQINIPKLAKGGEQNALSLAITLNGAPLVTDGSVSDLPKYLNSAMPAGEYDILIHANPVTVTENDTTTTYPAFNTSFKINVYPKQLDTAAIQNKLTGSDVGNGQRFEFAYDGGLHLHDDVSDLLDDLNGDLNNNHNASSRAANYWLSLSAVEYNNYFGVATLKYNMDALQTSAYFTESELADLTNAPKGVGKHVVYYSISAPNYITLGGAQDTSRRNYRFTTVIYREISAKDIAESINGNTYVYNGGNVFATVNYSQYYSTAYKDAGGYVNAGSHAVTLTINDRELTRWKNETAAGVTLDPTQGTATITYTVQKAENKWLYTPAIVRWTWGDYNSDLNVISASAAFGSQSILYSVLNENKQPISVQVEIDGTLTTVSLSEFDAVTDDIAAALGSLSAGKYYLRGNVLGTTDYAALADFDFEFSVAKITNTWYVTPNMTNWQYTGFRVDGNFIVGEPNYRITGKTVKYGVFTTEPLDSTALDSSGNNIFTDIQSVADYLTSLTVGEYWLAAYYESTENYAELFHTSSFRVNKATNNSWSDDKLPTISGWTYGEYASGLFTDGEADFGTPLYTVQIVGQSGGQGSAVAGFAGLSYSQLAAKLGALNAGSYNLYVTTNSTANYAAARALNVKFTIAKAANAWVNEPTIDGWIYGSAVNITADYQTQYANGGITKEFYLARMVNNVWIADESKGAIADITKADAGIYVYIVTAAASANYDWLKSVTSFEIQKRTNAWKKGKEPTLFYNWMSGEADYTFNMPEAEAHTELMRFDLLHLSDGTAKNGMDAQTFLTELKKLTNGTFQVRMYIGNDIIYSSETEQNRAALESYKKNYYYISSTCEIHIAPRVNSFKYEPRISTILYLGDRKSWAQPTAEATLADSEIEFTYKDAVTGEGLGNEIPTTPGRYILTATATASFSEPIARSVEFRVEYSPNSWVSAPTIDGWQEDAKPNAPTANASVGSDKVVYTYASVNTPNITRTERPKAAGEYIMYAVLEMDGYETLRAEYRFTIAPAFDTQLVIAAIVLTAIAIALAAVVLYFAIRRYKEN